MRNAVAAQDVSDDALRLVPHPAQQAPEETLGSRGVPPLMDQDVEHDTVLVHRAPEVVQLAVDAQEHLILSAKS